MIVAERKSMEAVLGMMAPYRKILIVGCATCTSVCLAGGEREVATLAPLVRMARQTRGEPPLETLEATAQRQCDREFIEPIAGTAKDYDAVLSLGCGAGVQMVADILKPLPVIPALNTRFIGVTVEPGWWAERCRGCGECILDRTGGICPITRCSKGLLNGPCGGYRNGKCEVDPTVDCGWLLIFERLKALGELERMREILGPKDWSVAAVGRPRNVVRQDVKASREEVPG